MSNYFATVSWKNQDEDFVANAYSRAHEWHFDGGAVVAASASPHIVPTPWSRPENVDPEEAFVAALASCHMLFFLSIAAGKKLEVLAYTDTADGLMEKNPVGQFAMTRVTLKPKVEFAEGTAVSETELAQIHHLAHDKCFIANSVTSEIVIEPQI